MTKMEYGPLIDELSAEYAKRFPRSEALHREACRFLVDGGSHALRLMKPFPPRIASAKGGRIRDEDGHDILDFWQGHMANVLGHNPEVVTSALAEAFAEGFGLQVGMTDRLQVEVAEILCRRTGAERVRLTTSGSLAGMYAVMLARAFTGRDLVLKVGGGWHGAHPWSLKGSKYHGEDGVGFSAVDSAGLPTKIAGEVVVTGFNDPQRLEDDFSRYGDRLACFVVEPVIGAGGMIPATREYLQLARRLTREHGALLILDEVINGFRFRAGNVASFYEVEGDLAVYAKAIGGGMPLAAVAGREEVMGLAGRARGRKVAAHGGTYSGHPATLLAAKIFMTYLVEHESEVYGRLSDLGQKMRDAMAGGFAAEGIHAVCTGASPELPSGSSLGMVSFPYEEGAALETPEAVFDPAVCDVALRTEVLPVAMLLEDVHMVEGHGAVSIAHTDEEMEKLRQTCQSIARRVKPYKRARANMEG